MPLKGDKMMLIELLDLVEKQYIRKNPYRPIICNFFNKNEYYYIDHIHYNTSKNQLECLIEKIDKFYQVLGKRKRNSSVSFPCLINAENVRDEVLYYTKWTKQVDIETLEQAIVVYKEVLDKEWQNFYGVTCHNNYYDRHLSEIHLILGGD